jgi:menaquinone-9 beta-reductase
MTQHAKYDVVIVGASLAGCAAAMLLGKHGLTVALIDRELRTNAYKKVCTHLIQSSATPTIERLGLAGPIEAAGGIKQVLEIYTPWGWIRDDETPKDRPAYGYNLRREKLDPMIRGLAAETPGVDFMPGHTVESLVVEDGRAVGVKTTHANGGERIVTARLLIAADGRYSRVAQLSGNQQKATANGRFTYSAYYSDLPMPKESTSKVFFLDPDWASVLRTDDGLVMFGAMPTKDKLKNWKGNIEEEFLKYFDTVPGAPSPRQGKRVSPFLGMLEMPTISRKTVHNGIAFIGDAAFAADPLWGVGCGYALQTAEWLVDSVAEALHARKDLAGALKRYSRKHKATLAGHEFVMTDYISGRRYNPIERLMNSAAARDPACAAHVIAFGSRNSTLRQFLAPSAISRAIWVNIKHELRGRKHLRGNPAAAPYSTENALRGPL